MSSSDAARNSQEYWQAHIEACKDQSSSKAKYCRNNELTYHCFIYWHAKFSEKVHEGMDLKTNSSKLIPVALAQSVYTAELQIHLPNGVMISGISDQSISLIGRLINQL
ncbi:MAG: hypothetical protein ACI9UN_003556 [Granulosicoccus sp.]|jgi:hypothetical protein